MMRGELERVYEELRAWCRERGHAGHDPFDALNSRLFRATPLKHSRLARLAWTQAFKRSPVNLRPLALVPAGRNAKGTALFALAALARLLAAELLDPAEAAELKSDIELQLTDSRDRKTSPLPDRLKGVKVTLYGDDAETPADPAEPPPDAPR